MTESGFPHISSDADIILNKGEAAVVRPTLLLGYYLLEVLQPRAHLSSFLSFLLHAQRADL